MRVPTKKVGVNASQAAIASLKAASVTSWVAGLGFGLPGVYGMIHYQSTQEVWTFLGFPTYGSGPFEDRGIDTSVPLLATFNALCAAEIASGWLLWRRRKAGAVLSLAILPLELAFWYGFDLPYGPPLGVARTVFVLGGWRSLKRSPQVGLDRPGGDSVS